MYRYQLDPVPGEEVGIRSITIAGDASMLAVANSHGTCFIWFLKDGQDFIPLQEMQAHDQYILKALLSSDNRYLATCSSDHSVKIWEAKVIEEEDDIEFVLNKTLYGHTKWVWDCAFTCDSAYIITGSFLCHYLVSTDTVGKVWNTEKGEVEINLEGHQKGITCLALNDRE